MWMNWRLLIWLLYYDSSISGIKIGWVSHFKKLTSAMNFLKFSSKQLIATRFCLTFEQLPEFIN